MLRLPLMTQSLIDRTLMEVFKEDLKIMENLKHRMALIHLEPKKTKKKNGETNENDISIDTDEMTEEQRK